MKSLFLLTVFSFVILREGQATPIKCYLPNGTETTKKAGVLGSTLSDETRKNACNAQVPECLLHGGCTSPRVPPKK